MPLVSAIELQCANAFDFTDCYDKGINNANLVFSFINQVGHAEGQKTRTYEFTANLELNCLFYFQKAIKDNHIELKDVGKEVMGSKEENQVPLNKPKS